MEILELVPVQDIQAMQISSNIDQILLDAQIELWFVRHGICSRYDTLLTIMMSSTHTSTWNYLNMFEPWHNQNSQVHNKSHTMVKSPDAWHSNPTKRKMTLVRFQQATSQGPQGWILKVDSMVISNFILFVLFISYLHSTCCKQVFQSFGLSLPSPIQSVIKS